MLSSLLSFEGLSVEIVLVAVLADDYAAVVYVFVHSVLGGGSLDRADAIGGGVERDADEAGGCDSGHTEVAEASSESAARVAEEAELILVVAALADAEGEDGGVVGSVYLERRAAERAGGSTVWSAAEKPKENEPEPWTRSGVSGGTMSPTLSR